MDCPLMQDYCNTSDCAWWFPDSDMCAIKKNCNKR